MPEKDLKPWEKFSSSEENNTEEAKPWEKFSEFKKKKEKTKVSSVASQEVAELSTKSGVVSDRTKSKIRGLGDSAISEAVEVEQYIDSKEDKVAQSVESISGRFTKGVTEYEDELSDYDSTKKSAISTLRQIQKANKPVYLQDELGNDISVSKQDNLAAERLNPLTKELYQKGAATIENTRKAFKANYIDENPEIISELESDNEDKVEAANKKIFDAWVKEPEILSGNERVRKGRSFIEVTYDSFREGMDERDYNVMIAQDLSSATEEEAKKILEMEYKNYLDKGADIQYNDSYEIPKMFGSQAVPIARGTALSLIPGAGTAASIIYGASDAAITSYGAEYLGSYIQARAQGMKEDESFGVAKNQANLAAGIGAVEGALGSFTGRLSTKLGGKLGGYASKALKPLITSATTGASDAGLDAAAAGIGQVINNGYAQSQDLNRGLFDGVADEMIGEIIFSTGMKIPTTVNTVADFRKYVKSLPIKEQQKILNNVIDNKENIERKILNDRTNDYLNLKGQEALNDGDEQLANKVKENPLEVLKNDLARLQKVKDNIKDETAIVEIDKNISAITQMIDNVEKRVVVKEGDVENILSTDDIKDKINDEDFVAKVANGEIDIKISNDEKLGNDLAKKVEEYKNKQNDNENKTGVSSEEQTGEKFVEKQSIEKTGDETVETGGDVQKTKVKDNEYAKSEVERVKSLPIENEDGATMNLDGSKYEKGGLVIPLTSKNVKASELTPEMIDDFIDENSESIGGETVKVGIYKFPNQDQVSIDLNIVADPSMREDALKIGLELGQKSLYDLNTGKPIETGADGMNPKALTPKEFLDIQNRLTKVEPKVEETTESKLASKDRVFNEINSIADKVKAKTSSKANPKEVNKRIFNDAVSYLQQSKWYEEASDVDRENAYREVAKMFEQPIKRSPSLKVKDTSKKISITEKEGLVKQVKDTMKGFKEGIKSQQAINQEVKGLIKEFSVKGYINNTQLKALTNKALSVRLDNIKSQNDFAAYFNKVMDDVDYDRKLSEASKMIKSAKKKSKSKGRLYNLAALDKLVSQIDPILVEDMDALLLALNEYNSDKPVANVIENTANLQKFVDETIAAKEKKLRDSAKESLNEVLGEGDFDGLTTKEMLELLDSVEDVNETAQDKLEGKKNVLRKAVRPIQMLLSNYDKTSGNELDSDEKSFLGKLASVDSALLSLNDLKNLFIVGNNILINNNFANAGNLSTRFGTIMEINRFVPKIKNNRILKNGWWNKNLRSLPSMLDAIFGDHVSAAKLMKIIGEEKASKGRRIVKARTEKYIDDLANTLNKGGLNTVEGRAKVTAAALLLRHDGYHGMTAEEEFQAVKKDLATNVKNWEGDADFVEELGAAKEALSFAEQFKTKEDLIEYIDKDKSMKNAIDFVQESFAELVDTRERASEYYFNTPLLRVNDNYVPKKVVFKDGKVDESKPFEDKIAKVGLKQKQSGSINPAQAPGNLGKNNLNLDILSYSSFELENVLQEIHLSESRLMTHEALVNNQELKEKINPSTARLLKEKIELQYNPVRIAPDNYYFARINEALRQIGTAAVLGGFTQPIKQSSVLANIAATLGSDADVFMYELATGLKNFKGLSMVNPVVKSQVSNKIHDMYSIGSRVEMNVGIDRGETMKQRRAIPHTGARLVSNTLEFIGKARGVASDLFLYPMHVQDIFISTATWNAAYKSYLAKNGITNIDMKNEHLKIENDAIRQEAAAYAEQIVGVTQIPSDAAQRAEMMKDASLGIKFLRGVAMPFSNFAFNTMVRKFDSIRGIFTKGRAMKSGRELAGLVAESAAFSLSKYYIATALYPTIMNAMYSVLTGDDEDWIKVDDEEKERRLKMSRDFLIKDLVLQGVQDGIAEDIILGYNKLMYASCVNNDLTDKTYDEWVKSSSASLYQYKKAKELATESAGVYGIMPSKLMEAYSTTKLRQDHGVETKYGEKILKLTKKEEEALYLIETIQWMNATGMFDADATVMAGKAKSKIVRDAPKEKKPFDPKQFIKNIEKQIRDIEKGVQ